MTYGTVSGFIEREIISNECPSIILVFPIQGISMERNRDTTFQKNGYVVFLRNTVSEDSVHLNNHKHYDKELYNPCMDYIYKVMHGFDNDITVEVSDEFQSIGWNDCDIIMLAAIVKEEIGRQCIENTNIGCKKSVKITRFEQMCEVSIISNLMKHIEKQTILKYIPFYSLSSVIDVIFLVERNVQVTSQGKKSKNIELFSCSFPLYVG